MSEASVIINSVDRALDILLYLYNKGCETTITAISQDLDIYKSTAYRTLVTLQNKGFVDQNPENGRYTLGVKFFVMGLSIGDKLGIQQVVRPYAQKLHDEFGEAVNVSVLEKNPLDVYRSIIIWKVEGSQILRFNSELGSRNDCHCAGVGKCLLAFGRDIDLSVYEKLPMVRYTAKTIQTIDQLKDELARVREQGYALDDEEREEGLTCAAVPILRRGVAVAAMSISGPSYRIREAPLSELIRRLREVSREITASMG
ncbi:MAG: IclR family transcriptional regulator [Oscillospiraceae bacterium]